jgi:hypothetical protein
MRGKRRMLYEAIETKQTYFQKKQSYPPRRHIANQWNDVHKIMPAKTAAKSKALNKV